MSRTFLLLTLLLSFSCANKIQKMGRDVKYSALEKVGFEKRDLFKREVKKVKAAQEDSGEEFQNALTTLKEVYAFDGGDLERNYEKLSDSYEEVTESADEVRTRVSKLETVADDLFSEWTEEIDSIKTSELKSKSRSKLNETQKRFNRLRSQLHRSTAKMTPVLNKFQDQVLFIKHNLNAAAVGSLKSEGDQIQLQVKQLLKAIEKSTSEAEALIKTL